MTISRLMNLPLRRLTDNELNWLKNRTKDSREEVRMLAKEIYSQRFPHAERNQMKKQLHIKELTFTVNSYAWDEYGDEVPASGRFYMMRSEPIISMQAPDGLAEPTTIRLEQGKYSKMLKSLIHYYEVFCWDKDYGSGTFSEDDDLDFESDDISGLEDIREEEINTEEAETTWSISIKYTNGTEQNILGSDEYLPDKVGELYWNLADLF